MSRLSARPRQSGSTATPVCGRPISNIPELPPYEPQIAPLNEEAQRALEHLLQTHSTRRFKAHLDIAAAKVSEAAFEINEQSSQARSRYANKRAKLQANGKEIDREDVIRVGALTGKIEGLTKRLDTTMRELVDNQVFIAELPEIMDQVKAKTSNASTQPTATTLTQTQRRTRRVVIDEDEEDADMEDVPTQDATSQPPLPSPQSTASNIFKSSLAAQTDSWNAKSLTSRYSRSNTYIGFYKSLHEGRNGASDAPPPVPHADTWFAAEEAPDASVLQVNNNASDEESDLEIASERVSTRCPITLLPFRDPVSSTKCPHSFEREAIMSMMRSSNSARSQRTQTQTQTQGRGVKCPVCSLLLTENDLQADPVLMRKVKRVEAAEAQANEENSEEEEDEVVKGSQRRAQYVGSSPASASKAMARRVKEERMSGVTRAASTDLRDGRGTAARTVDAEIDRIPGTQMTDGGAVMVDLGEDDDDDDDDEEGGEDEVDE